MKIIYTDYHYAVVYQCNHVTSGGECPPGQMEVDVLSRERNSRNHDVMGIIAAVVPSVCLNRNHFERTYHEGKTLVFGGCIGHVKTYNSIARCDIKVNYQF